MRAICCAILAYTTWQMGCGAANGRAERRQFIAGIFVFISFVLVVVSAGLCIAGL